MKKIFLMILELMFVVGNANAQYFVNISENNQIILLDDEEDEIIDEVVNDTIENYEDGDFEDDGEDDDEDDDDDEE